MKINLFNAIFRKKKMLRQIQSNLNLNPNQMKDIKGTLSTILGIVATICGVILALPNQGIQVSSWLLSVAGGALALCVGLIGYLTGKNPDASAKTPAQLEKVADEKKAV